MSNYRRLVAGTNLNQQVSSSTGRYGGKSSASQAALSVDRHIMNITTKYHQDVLKKEMSKNYELFAKAKRSGQQTPERKAKSKDVYHRQSRRDIAKNHT